MRTASRADHGMREHALAELERRRLDLLREQDFLLLRERRDLGDVAEIGDERSRARPSARSSLRCSSASRRTRTPPIGTASTTAPPRCPRRARASAPAPRRSSRSSSWQSCLATAHSSSFRLPSVGHRRARLAACTAPVALGVRGSARLATRRSDLQDPLLGWSAPVGHGAALAPRGPWSTTRCSTAELRSASATLVDVPAGLERRAASRSPSNERQAYGGSRPASMAVRLLMIVNDFVSAQCLTR